MTLDYLLFLQQVCSPVLLHGPFQEGGRGGAVQGNAANSVTGVYKLLDREMSYSPNPFGGSFFPD